MFKKVLIANRSEVALRIIRACQQLQIKTVAVYAQVEAQAPFVQAADEAICIGPDTASSTYLKREAILMAAIITGADAIHPGYGFLAEDALFAEMCAECQLTLIGPSPAMIRLMADKAAAKAYVQQKGVAVIPGAANVTPAQLSAVAAAIGFPLMLKASLGGGGKGMRLIQSAAELQQDYHLIREEARQAFLSDAVYLEKYLPHARHIEVQILVDHAGHIQIFGDRECSLQVNHQKIIEESPASCLTDVARQQLYQATERVLQGLAYCGVGTLEFLYAQGQFYFLEMNTRLQVEHGVTELTTGKDLVVQQIAVAAGATIPTRQLAFQGHAIEVRLNANGAGDLQQFQLPTTVRIETGYQAGMAVLPYYDALLAKLLVWQPTREAAIAKLQQALQQVTVKGVQTNLKLLQQLLADPHYQANQVDIHFLKDFHRPD